MVYSFPMMCGHITTCLIVVNSHSCHRKMMLLKQNNTSQAAVAAKIAGSVHVKSAILKKAMTPGTSCSKAD